MTLRCSFCNKTTGDVACMIRGNVVAGRGDRSAAICDECVELCTYILLKRKYANYEEPTPLAEGVPLQ